MMAVYTVLEPPPSGDDLRDAERVAFVRDGFSWLAFLFPLLWLLWHRMWLVLVLWIAVVVLVEWGASFLGGPAPLVAALAIAVVVGFEANNLRRWTLERRGWQFAGVVAGTDRSDCERRFFAGRAGGLAPARPAAAPPRPASAVPTVYPSARPEGDEAHVLGLFPTAERPR
jgi:hypothetical protein